MTGPAWTLEKMLTARSGFDLPASPLQRALARAADGRPVPASLLDDEALEAHFGPTVDRASLGDTLPSIVVVVAGVRSGKSLLAGCAAVKACLTADLSALKLHEVPRFAIVAPTVDNATATYRLLVGPVQSSPVLRKMVALEPTVDTLCLRRPDGRLVEIVVVAAHRGAVTLRSRWLVGFVLDECALFGVESQGAAVNAEELLIGGETRLVEGGQAWIISSPFGPGGLLYSLWTSHFGKPGRVLVIHAPTRAMNPAFPVKQIEAVRQRTPDAAAREYDALWVDPDTAMLDGVLLDAAVRAKPLEESRKPESVYVAAWDAATRGNAWTLVVGRAETAKGDELPRVTIALARQWVGSKVKPLDPDKVIAEIAGILKRYGVREVACDGWGADALRAIAHGHGIKLRDRTLSTADTFALFDFVRTLLLTEHLELPPQPILVQDLKGVRKKGLANGIKVDLLRTSDGRHCDFAPAVALVCAAAPRAEKRGDGGAEAVRGLIEDLRARPPRLEVFDRPIGLPGVDVGGDGLAGAGLSNYLASRFQAPR